MKNAYLLSGMLILFSISFAQLPGEMVPGKVEIAALKKSTLVVVLLQEDQKLVDKLNKKKKQEQVEGYKSAIENYNKNIQAMVPKYLTISENVVYKTMEDILSMEKTEKMKSAFLLYNTSGRTMSEGNVI